MQAVDNQTTTSPTVAHPPTRAGERRPTTRSRVGPARRALALLLILVGTLLLADGAVTVLWQEPVTSIYAHWRQARLERQLADLQSATPTTAERDAIARVADPRSRLARAAHAFVRQTHAGDPLARLRIPRIGISAVVVQGTGAAQLREGPGHYPRTPLPGEPGTVAIAGHRTTFGAWFRHIDRLKRFDLIQVTLPYGRFTYRVERTRVVASTALWITKRVRYDRLVLSACHPLFSASQRIVVFARLVRARLTWRASS